LDQLEQRAFKDLLAIVEVRVLLAPQVLGALRVRKGHRDRKVRLVPADWMENLGYPEVPAYRVTPDIPEQRVQLEQLELSERLVRRASQDHRVLLELRDRRDLVDQLDQLVQLVQLESPEHWDQMVQLAQLEILVRQDLQDHKVQKDLLE